MEREKLIKANELLFKIEQLKMLINKAKTQKCTWIEFTHGNRSDKGSVCDDEHIIMDVRALIIEKNEIKLASLEKQFSDL